MNDSFLRTLGMDDPAEEFWNFKERGNEILSKLRQSAVSPDQQKTMRTFGPGEAAELIGRSAPWLRENDENPQLDERGRKVYTLDRINELRDLAGTRYRRPAGSRSLVCPVANFKGGAGKTTTTVNLAQYAALQGLRVLVVDFDPQATCTFSVGGYIADLELEGEDTIYRALVDDFSDIKRVARSTYFPGIDLIPANLSLQDLELLLPNNKGNNSDKLGPAIFRFKQSLELIREDYDIILVDCGPNMGSLTANAMTAADAMVVPIPPQTYDLASFVMFTSTLFNLFEATQAKLDYFRILMTKHSGTNQARQVDSLIRKLYGEYVLSNFMCVTVEVEKASADMSTIYDTRRPRSNKETYQRALTHMNSVNEEIVSDFKTIWDEQAKANVA